MAQKFSVDGKEYDLEKLTDQAKGTVAALDFVVNRIQELENMQALFRRAKNSYVESLKKEMLSSKAGLILDDE